MVKRAMVIMAALAAISGSASACLADSAPDQASGALIPDHVYGTGIVPTPGGVYNFIDISSVMGPEELWLSPGHSIKCIIMAPGAKFTGTLMIIQDDGGAVVTFGPGEIELPQGLRIISSDHEVSSCAPN